MFWRLVAKQEGILPVFKYVNLSEMLFKYTKLNFFN